MNCIIMALCGFKTYVLILKSKPDTNAEGPNGGLL